MLMNYEIYADFVCRFVKGWKRVGIASHAVKFLNNVSRVRRSP